MIDEQLATHGLPDRAAGALYLAAVGYRLTNETYRSQAETTAGTASRDLRALVDSGLLEARGEKRGRSYTATAELAPRWRDAAATIRSRERVDPYLAGEARTDPYAQLRLM